MKRYIHTIALSLGSLYVLAAVLSSCDKDEPGSYLNVMLAPEEGEELSGGSRNTVYDASENAFAFPSPALTGLDELEFFVGNSFFNQNWVTSPASTTARDGLGPVFNARSCSGCHFKDGRGRAPEVDGELTSGLLLRLSIPGMGPHGGPLGDPTYGGQLNDQSILDVPTEASFRITYTETSGQFDDGTSWSLRKPEYWIENPSFGPFSDQLMVSPRVGQQIIGLGLLEAIHESDLLAYVDEGDADNDGISGRANYVWDAEHQETRMGRFGWKANQPSLRQQTAGAFLGDIGITSPIFPDENCTGAQQDCEQAENGGSPEIEEDDLQKTVLYVASLAVPARRSVDDPEVLQGREVFKEIGCAGCHVPSYTTGAHPDFDHLSNEKIWPYSDLLLHDMGDELADNRPDFLANGNEWRTPPLWGIGLFQTVNRHTNYLHDGRARNLTEAILWHGGEGQRSRDNFAGLSTENREALISFLESL